jgi:hypothetical protein
VAPRPTTPPDGIEQTALGTAASMRNRSVVNGLLLVWLLFGALAAYQRGYFGDDRAVNCRTFGDTTLTILAGPLNYFGVNPKIDCASPDRERNR